jgi:hypothetical protein
MYKYITIYLSLTNCYNVDSLYIELKYTENTKNLHKLDIIIFLFLMLKNSKLKYKKRKLSSFGWCYCL